jgi:hypothetical protein
MTYSFCARAYGTPIDSMICHMSPMAEHNAPTQITKQPKTPMELRSQSFSMSMAPIFEFAVIEQCRVDLSARGGNVGLLRASVQWRAGSVDKTCYVPAIGSPKGEMKNCEA